MVMVHNSLTRDELIKDLLSVIAIPDLLIIIISTHTRRKRSVRIMLVVMMMIVVVIRQNLLHKGDPRFNVALAPLLSSVDVNRLGEGRQDLVVLSGLGTETPKGVKDVLRAAEGFACVAVGGVICEEGEA